MKTYLTITVCWLFLSLKSQTPTDKVLLKYSYTFNHGFAEGVKRHIQYQSFLYLNNELAYYVELPKKPGIIEFGDERKPVLLQDTTSKSYIDLKNNLVLSKGGYNKIHPHPIYVDTAYNMKWQLIDESKLIDSLKCKKAICKYRGREYVAWYQPDLSLPYGPAKFGGLPGLIVELYDIDYHMHFLLSGIAMHNLVIEPIKGDYTPYAIWVKEELSFRKKIKEAMRASNNEGNCNDCEGSSDITFTDWEKLEE